MQASANRFTSTFAPYTASNSGYVSAAYRIGAYTPYAAISGIRSDQDRRAEEMARLGASALLTDTARYILGAGQRHQHTYSLGVRHDLRDNLALKLQLDRIRNKTCSPVALPMVSPAPPCAPPFLWPGVPVNWNGKATIYSATLDFVF